MFRIDAKADDVDFATSETGGDFDAGDQSGFIFERLPAEQRIMIRDGETVHLLAMHRRQQLTRRELAIAVMGMQMEVDAHGAGLCETRGHHQ